MTTAVSASPARPPSSKSAAPVVIRAAVAADLDALVRLEESAFSSDRLSRRSLRTLIARPSATLLVAEAAGRLLGALLILYRRGSRIARLYSLSVAAEARGAGIGSALLSAAERDATARGAATIRLEVRADNAGAIALYRRHGYRHIGDRAAYYADGGDAQRFARSLSPTEPPKPGVARAPRRVSRKGRANETGAE